MALSKDALVRREQVDGIWKNALHGMYLQSTAEGLDIMRTLLLTLCQAPLLKKIALLTIFEEAHFSAVSMIFGLAALAFTELECQADLYHNENTDDPEHS